MYLIVRANANRYRDEFDRGQWRFPLYVEASTGELMTALALSRPALYAAREELERANMVLTVSGDGKTKTAYVVLLALPTFREKAAKGPCEITKIKHLVRLQQDPK